MSRALRTPQDILDLLNMDNTESLLTIQNHELGKLKVNNSTRILKMLDDIDEIRKEGSINVLSPDSQFHISMKGWNVCNINLERSDDTNISDLECKRLSITQGTNIINNSKIGELHIYPTKNIDLIRVSNCIIGRILFDFRHETCRVGEISFEDTDAYEISFPKGLKIHLMDIRGLRIHTKTILIEDSSDPKLDRQSITNLRHWAESHGDSSAAHIARAYELAAEMEFESGTNKLALRLWDFFGEFGLTASRPMLYLAFSAILSFALFYIFGSSIGLPENYYVGHGWLQGLCGDSISARIHRSAVGALQPIFNPLNIFSTRSLVVPNSYFMEPFIFTQSVFSLGMLLISGFSLRRRFLWR